MPLTLVATRLYETDSGAADGGAVSSGSNGVTAVAATCNYSSAGAKHGALGLVMTSGGNISYSAGNTGTRSFYGSLVTASLGTALVCSIKNASTILARIRLNSTGTKFDIADNGSTQQAVSTTTYTVGQDYRCDVQWTYNAGTGNITVEARFFLGSNKEGTTADVTLGPVAFASSAAVTRFSMGPQSTGWSFYADTLRDYGTDISAWPGPFVASGAVAMTETSTMTVDGTPTFFAAVAMTETAVMIVAGVVGNVFVAMAETSTLTVAGTPTFQSAVAMTETSTLTAAGAIPYAGVVAMAETSAMTVAADLGYDLHPYEEGTNGATVPSGSNSVVAVIGSPTYATTAAIHGALGVHAGPTSANVGYANPAAAGSSGQIYGKIGTFGTIRNAFVRFADSSGVTQSSISLTVGGTFAIVIGSIVAATSTVAVAAGDLFRIDWQAAWNGTNMAITARIFVRSNSEGRTRDQEITASLAQASNPARIYAGTTTGTWDLVFDTLRLYSGLTWPAPFNPSITPGTVVHTWSGDPLSDGFVVTCKTSGSTSLRLAVSTVVGMTSPTWFAAQTPDSAGYTTHIPTGLTPATKYYYQLADSPIGGVETLIGTPGIAKTTPAAGSPANFTVALASCQGNASVQSAACDDIVAWDPTFMCHVGDMHYRGSTSTIPSDHAGLLEAQIQAAAGLKNLLAKVPVIYNNSDHEAGPDNGDSNTAWNAAFNAMYRQVVPGRLVDTLPSPVGKYRTWVVGRIRFILLDIRNTDRSPGAAVDDSAKTMLGATQKTWFKAQLLQPEPLKVVIADNSWMGTSIGFQWQDKWQSYGTERQELADFITLNHVQVDFWHGDSHFLGVDATHNAWGGFPVLCGSPLDQPGSTTDVAFFDSSYSAGVGPYSQYMRISFTDDGVTITRSASGWDALSSVQRVSQVHTWSSTASGVVAMAEMSTLAVAGVKAQAASVAMAETSLMTADTSNPTTVATIRLRRNTRAGAIASNPIILSGEPGWDGDALRIGNAAGDHWNDRSQTMMEGAGTIVFRSGNYSAVATDRVIVGNGSTITITLPLPSATGTAGRRIVVKNVHSTNLTVDTAGGNIDGAATLTLAQWAKAELVSDGTNWLTI